MSSNIEDVMYELKEVRVGLIYLTGKICRKGLVNEADSLLRYVDRLGEIIERLEKKDEAVQP